MNIRVELLDNSEDFKVYKPTGKLGTLIYVKYIEPTNVHDEYFAGMIVFDDGTFEEITNFRCIRAVKEDK